MTEQQRQRRKQRKRRKPPSPTIKPAFESPDEFARQLAISRSTVWRLMNAGRVRYVKIGPKTRRIPTSERERITAEAFASQ